MSIEERELLISLVSAEAEGKPLDIGGEVDYASLLALAEHHSVANIVCYALERSGAAVPDGIMAKFRRLRDKALMSDIQQQADFEQLCSEFGEAGIRFIPLKGILLKSLYPQSDYRTMSDIDLLIDEENAARAREIMCSLGYTVDSVDLGVHDEFLKMPSTRVEIHRELFGAEGGEYAPLFTDPWSMCRVSNGRWEFTEEAFFLYILAHGMKHYSLGGTGIRTFLDISIYLRHADIDLDGIYAKFDSVGQRQLCEDIIALSRVWFDGAEHTERTRSAAEYILKGGTYGTFENQVQHELQSKSKAGYVFSKLFPNLKTMRQRYPVLKKAPVLLPIFWLVRIVTKPFQNRRQNMEKIKALFDK